MRAAMTEKQVQDASQRICEQIVQMPEFQRAKTIAIYYPMNQEVRVLPLLEQLEKRFCFPKIIQFAQSTMDFFEPGNTFHDSAFGMKEPTGNYVAREEIDLFIIPGIAFSRQGYRIGYGKGFYDHYLSGLDVPKVGVAYDFQILNQIPHHEQDQRMTALVSEKGVTCILQSS